jgi:hypothetical protein
MARRKVHNVTVSDPITLDDLRWLVEQTNSFPPDTKVTVTGRKEYNQMDWDPATITVHGS